MSVTAADVRAYAAKAEEYLESAEQNLEDGRHNAATSAAVHAGINAADAITGALRGLRSSDADHGRAVDLLSPPSRSPAASANASARRKDAPSGS